MKKVSSENSEEKKEKNSVRKGIGKRGGGDPCKGLENRPRRQKSEDKRWDRFKKKM
ncbi:30952_t:CDS:1, partial [Gigaspora margarita]